MPVGGNSRNCWSYSVLTTAEKIRVNACVALLLLYSVVFHRLYLLERKLQKFTLFLEVWREILSF
jgi:hypothetical protein